MNEGVIGHPVGSGAARTLCPNPSSKYRSNSIAGASSSNSITTSAPPGTMSGCVWRQSIVVCRQPGVRVGGDPDVMLVWTADALQDVDESFGEGHAAATARCRPPRNSSDLALPERNVAISALDP